MGGGSGGRGAGRGKVYAAGPEGRPERVILVRGTLSGTVGKESYKPAVSSASEIPVVETLAMDLDDPRRESEGRPGGGIGARLFDLEREWPGTGGRLPWGGIVRGGRGRGRGGRGRAR